MLRAQPHVRTFCDHALCLLLGSVSVSLRVVMWPLNGCVCVCFCVLGIPSALSGHSSHYPELVRSSYERWF